jgi:peroxiredoxin family protein
MFSKTAQILDHLRGALPDRYRLPNRYAPAVFLSSFVIALGGLSLIFMTYFGVQLFSFTGEKPADLKGAGDDLMVEMRAHAYMEIATWETSKYRLNLSHFQQAADFDQRDSALRRAKAARLLAIQHLNEAQDIAIAKDRQPDFATLRADLDDLDYQLATTPATQSHCPLLLHPASPGKNPINIRCS